MSSGYSACSFASVYLAYGYIQGWAGASPESSADRLEDAALRDLYLEADNFQQLYFAGPDVVDVEKADQQPLPTAAPSTTSTPMVSRSRCRRRSPRRTPTSTSGKGAAGCLLRAGVLDNAAELPDPGSPPGGRLGAGGGPSARKSPGESNPEPSWQSLITANRRLLVLRGSVPMRPPAVNRLASDYLPEDNVYDGVVCKPRWFNWLLPKGVDLTGLKHSRPTDRSACSKWRSTARRMSLKKQRLVVHRLSVALQDRRQVDGMSSLCPSTRWTRRGPGGARRRAITGAGSLASSWPRTWSNHHHR